MLGEQWRIAPDGRFANPGSDRTVFYILTIEPLGTPEGEPADSGATHEVLVRADVTELPATSASWVGLESATLDPGAEFSLGPQGNYGDGAFLALVESGAIELTADGAITVIAAGEDAAAAAAAVPNGPVVLGPGDRVFVPTGVHATWRSTGTEPATWIAGSLAKAVSMENIPESLEARAYAYRLSEPWPELPVVATLHRLTLEPGATVPVSEFPGLSVLGVDAGSLGVPLVSTNAATPTRTRSFDAGEGLLIEQWSIAPDGSFSNAGPDPVVVYILTVEPAESTASTPSS
jgi:hypothetical protein